MDSIARQRSAISTSRRSSISATFSADGLRMDPPKSRLFRVGRHQRKSGLASSVGIYKLLSCPHPRLLQHDSKPHQVVQEGRPFVWGPEQEKSLQDLKTAFANSDFLLIR
ncbi:hypothetical protein BASA83_011932 [Batrachochytrium salamandrivorans]|nr:hypothetical protein BASA83_011932 [Batrachochytrium salamandrivorans]